MVTVTTALGYGRTLDIRTMNFSTFFDGEEVTADSTSFVASHGGGTRERFTGKGFVYDSDGALSGGTVTEFKAAVDGQQSWDFRGLKIDGARLGRVVSTEGRADDLKMLERALAGDDRFSGGRCDDRFEGFKGNDRLDGGRGDDSLNGGAGNDMLRGDVGRDTFVFNAALNGKTNVDVITDFSVTDDTIALDHHIFKGLAPGILSGAAFEDIGSGAPGPGHRILYDGGKGDLYFDRDGSGNAHEAVKFAHLDNHAHLVAADFLVV